MSCKKRVDSLDIISGVLILWMVIYHAFQWANLTNTSYFKLSLQCFFFFMPWFYFKSGMLHKSPQNTSIFYFLNKGVSRLIIPMLIWSFLGYLISIPIFILIDKTEIWKIALLPIYKFLVSGDMAGNAPLWFLLSLFIVQNLSFYVLKTRLKLIIALASLLLGYLLQLKSTILPLGLSTIPLGLFFYIIGNFYSTLEKKSILLIPAMLITVLLLKDHSSYVDFHKNQIWHGNYLAFTASSLSLIISIDILLAHITFNPLSWIGRKSIYFLVLHWPIFNVVKLLFFTMNIETNDYIFALTLALTSISVITFISMKFTPQSIFLMNDSIIEKILKAKKIQII